MTDKQLLQTITHELHNTIKQEYPHSLTKLYGTDTAHSIPKRTHITSILIYEIDQRTILDHAHTITISLTGTILAINTTADNQQFHNSPRIAVNLNDPQSIQQITEFVLKQLKKSWQSQQTLTPPDS